MTDRARIAEIEARLAAATPGDWEVFTPECEEYLGIDTADGKQSVVLFASYGGIQRITDATFIAHTPSDIRFLLDALRSARGEALEVPTESEIDAECERIMAMTDAELEAQLRAEGKDPAEVVRRFDALMKSAITIVRLRGLVQTLIDNDPNESAADGGVTVLDVWRQEARRALSLPPDTKDAI